MDEIPMEWVDKLFNCMTQFYGERWNKHFTKPHIEDFYKAVWKSGLQGCNREEIRNALLLCKRSALDKSAMPPHVMDFYFIAKGERQPYIDYHPKANVVKCSPEIQREKMAEIRRKLGMKARLEVYSDLGAK